MGVTQFSFAVRFGTEGGLVGVLVCNHSKQDLIKGVSLSFTDAFDKYAVLFMMISYKSVAAFRG